MVDELGALVRLPNDEDDLATRLNAASENLRTLLREIVKAGGAADYSELSETLGWPGSKLGAVRSRTALARELITEVQVGPRSWKFEIRPGMLNRLRNLLGT